MDTLQYCEIINDTTISSSGPERCSNKISILCPNCKKLICYYHAQLGHNDEKEDQHYYEDCAKDLEAHL